MRQGTKTGRHNSRVEAAVPAANFVPTQARRPFGYRSGQALPLQQRASAFTLAELLVSVGVLVLLVFLASQLLNSAATIATLGHKQMDADSQARQLLDRMAVDFAQMIKRPDVDYYVKSNPLGGTGGLRTVLQQGNDRIAFYSAVPGYFPTSNHKSPISVVAYRINSDNKMERMGKGLLWNGAPSPSPTPVGSPLPSPTGTPSPTPTSTPVVYTPTVFIPVPFASPLPLADLLASVSPTPNPLPTPAWPAASSATDSWAPDFEVIGPQVFRFEYYYLLKDGSFSDIPWTTINSTHNSVSGMQDVAAIVVDIAVIDPRSKALLDRVDPSATKLTRLNGADRSLPLLEDFRVGMAPGELLARWRAALDANTVVLPLPAISGVRVYERFIYLSPGTL